MEEMTSIITTLGFPIACVLACGAFILYIIKFIMSELIENRKTIHMAVETISRFNEKFDVLDDKVDKVIEIVQRKQSTKK